MSDSPPKRDPQPSGAEPSGGTFAIVASRYNERYVDAMLDAARDEIATSAPGASVSIHRVPGAFEIPTCIEAVVRRDRPDAVVALGVVIAGETAHADIVDLGTEFGVQVAGDRITTTVFTGEVELTTPGGEPQPLSSG